MYGHIFAHNLDLTIPTGFIVYGSLSLNGELPGQHPLTTPLRLPDDLTVNGILDVRNRVIEQWPKNLTVRGHLKTDKITGIINGLSRS